MESLSQREPGVAAELSTDQTVLPVSAGHSPRDPRSAYV
jgi:hypothetical protein